MPNAHVQCSSCGTAIQPETAAANAGLCGRCALADESSRQARQQFERALATGELFTPSPEELRSAHLPQELGNPDTDWRLDPDYYADCAWQPVTRAIHQVETAAGGHVFLVAPGGVHLNLSITTAYGVCEYQHEDTGEYRYAFTPRNLREQVAASLHVVQADPQCGVGMLWYPSRCHMPRADAVAIVSSLVQGDLPACVSWLELGDISYVSRGRG